MTTTVDLVAGVDEVGIGALAGPVVAAVVILGPNCVIDGITDSKKISGKKRESLATEIKDLALDWAIGLSSIEEIDSLNVLKASHLAMQRAVNDLIQKPSIVLVDGDKAPEFAFRTDAIVKGDQKIKEIESFYRRQGRGVGLDIKESDWNGL